MATLGELNILLSVKGLSPLKSGLKEVKTGVEEVAKSAEDSAKVFERAFKDQEKQFKAFSTELKKTARDIGELSRITRDFGLAVTGPFIAAFAIARKDLPEVDSALKDVTDSFKGISVELARAALPTLKEFAGLMKSASSAAKEAITNNSELLNVLLKFGAVAIVFSTLEGILSRVIKAFVALIGILKTLGVLTTTGALSQLGSIFLSGVAGASVLYAITQKIADTLNSIGANTNAMDVFKAISNPVGFATEKAAGFGASIFGGGASSSPIGVSMQGSAGSAGRGGAQTQVGEASQLTKQFLQTDLVAVQAALENVKQRTQESMEQARLMSVAISGQIAGVFGSLAQGIGDAVGQSIVFGQNFLDSMVNVLKSLASSIISMLVEVAAKVLILRALGVVGPIPAAALFGGGGGFAEAVGGSSGGKGIGGFFRSLMPFADGGIVTKPTAALIGEAGPEAVVPLDEMGSMGGNVTIHLHGHTFLNDESAIDKLARRISGGVKRATSRRTGGLSIAL